MIRISKYCDLFFLQLRRVYIEFFLLTVIFFCFNSISFASDIKTKTDSLKATLGNARGIKKFEILLELSSTLNLQNPEELYVSKT